MNIFFTCKNTLIILLQVYRLLVLCLERRPVYRRQSRLFSLVQPAFEPEQSQRTSPDPDPDPELELQMELENTKIETEPAPKLNRYRKNGVHSKKAR